MNKMVFRKPAANWHESLPAGNGKTAFTASGGRRVEKLWFNDAELWSGYPRDHDNPQSLDTLEKVRKRLASGFVTEAESAVSENMCGDYSEAFMPLATVKIVFSAAYGRGYARTLNLDSGILVTRDDVLERKAFVSYPHDAAVYSAQSKSAFSLTVSCKSILKSAVSAYDGVLTVSGNAPDYAAPNYLRTQTFPIRYDEGKAAAFALALKAVTDGEVKCVGNKKLRISKATYVRIYAVTRTGFKGYAAMPETDSAKICDEALRALAEVKAPYEEIERAHTEDYRALYFNQSLTLAEGEGDVKALLKRARAGKPDAELIELLYDFGKYMTICGSRASQPLNLQGQWNKEMRPPWSSNLTTNINAQMNYWGATRAGLEGCMKPFYEAVKEVAERGRRTAAVNYGARGFACNHNVDIWRNTSPVQGDPSYMYSPLCGAWLANEMFAHKKNCGKIDEDATRVISEAAEFILDYLWKYDGKLVTAPSTSPETAYTENGKRSSVGIASAYEMSVIRQTFVNCLESGADEGLKAEIRKALGELRPYEKAENGLAEWSGGRMSAEKGHRHFSPLYGVYPGNVVKEGSEEFAWAKELFDYRLQYASSPIGWSAAWAICLAARFRDKEAAAKTIRSFTGRSVMNNLFDFHPPRYFQIDGNMGFVAGINELLIQESDGVISLLPACYELIGSGEMKGAVVNGAKVDFRWKDGKVNRFCADRPTKIKNVNIAAGAELINAELI